MPTFLLWNVGQQSLDGHVTRLVQDHRVDIILLVERPLLDAGLLQILTPQGFVRLPSHDRFGFYTRLGVASFARLTPPEPNERTDYWRFWLRPRLDITPVVIHGPDRYNAPDDSDRRLFFARAHENICELEAAAGHKRTLVFGDFNANPFEESIGGLQGLHAISVREVGGRPYRETGTRRRDFFFNPMWSCYGRDRTGPLATHYFTGSREHEHYWHMIDQVVLRPDLLPFFLDNRLQILHRAGPVTLLTRSGHPDRTNASDHLPLLFQLSRRRRRNPHA
jgi:Endonuclease/Exonuclease/phosphatase family